jgi:hypothetical protein
MKNYKLVGPLLLRTRFNRINLVKQILMLNCLILLVIKLVDNRNKCLSKVVNTHGPDINPQTPRFSRNTRTQSNSVMMIT